MSVMKRKILSLCFLLSLVTLVFTACETEDETTPNVVSDIDGNSYNTVVIGTQTWIAENLQTTKYNDGTPISYIADNNYAWASAATGAYCWYNNDQDFAEGNSYGALYNWYAVETGKLCPSGWHVPTDDDWNTLENFLADNGYNYDGTTGGGRAKIAKALAKTTGWTKFSAPGVVGNTDYPDYRNKSGFSAMPSGFRVYYNGVFSSVNTNTDWWSSTTTTGGFVFGRSVNNYSANMYRTSIVKSYGLSVRCVKD